MISQYETPTKVMENPSVLPGQAAQRSKTQVADKITLAKVSESAKWSQTTVRYLDEGVIKSKREFDKTKKAKRRAKMQVIVFLGLHCVTYLQKGSDW